MSTKKQENLKGIITTSVIVVIIIVTTSLIIYNRFDNWQDRGAFGDMFGSVNALFSGLAFAGVIYAILLQRKELSLQREELELTRKELERSANAQEKSSQLLKQQVDLMLKSAESDARKELLQTEPIFISSEGTGNGRAIEFSLHNKGGTVKNIQINPIEENFKIETRTKGPLSTGQKVRVVILSSLGINHEFKFKINYQTLLGEANSKEVKYSHNDGLSEI